MMNMTVKVNSIMKMERFTLVDLSMEKRNGSGCVFKDEDLIQEGEFINDEYSEPKEIEEKGKILKKSVLILEN